MQSITEKSIKYAPEITWPKEFLELKLIDDALRCGICYDYIRTCMVTPCAHSYCSICIRRSLQYKTACPTCFEETFETSLRNNRVLDRVTELYSSIKEKLVKHLKIAAIHFNCNGKLPSNQSPAVSQNFSSLKSSATDTTPKRNLHKTSKSSSTKGKLNFTSPAEAHSISITGKSDISKRLEDILGSQVVQDSEMDCKILSSERDSAKIPMVPPMFLQPKIDTQALCMETPTVPCPVCNVNIPERNINAHLDNCLANADKPPVKSPVKMKNKRNPLPKMVWSLMGEKDLRKKLKDYGLNTQGDKKILISRVQRYILLFNSECDSDNPRPISDIIRQVEREEKKHPAQSHQRMFINHKCDPKVIEEENKKYIQENKESFKNLIEAMKSREGRNIKPLSHSSCRILSDDEDTNKHQQEQYQKPSTSKDISESIDLCHSNGSDESFCLAPSPGFGPSPCTIEELFNRSNSGSPSRSGEISDITSPSDKSMSKLSKTMCSDLDQLCSMLNSPDKEICDDSSPILSRLDRITSRTPSPSSVVEAHFSGSEDSISILVDTKTEEDEDCFGNSTQSVTKCVNVNNVNSQLGDPDFVLDTDSENNIDEVFIPQRRLKRKHKNSVVTDSKRIISPRRTRRRLSK